MAKYKAPGEWSADRPFPAPFFLDSGAHSLFMKEAAGRKGDRYAYYDTKEFWAYVDGYARFVLEHKDALEYYANVDVIFNPEKTWEVQRYLEKEYGLRPVPVIHFSTPLKWVDKYAEAGHDYLGVGGLGQEAPVGSYLVWADGLYKHLCPGPTHLPKIRTHGFAMTSYDLMVRYPWWSVDSASWAKAGAFGSVYVPHKRAGKFTFEITPYVVCFSHRSPATKIKGRHYLSLTGHEQKVVRSWLEEIEVPLGEMDGDKVKVQGVLNHYGSRGVANLRFFEALRAWLPEWPWPFTRASRRGFF